ncbi:LysR family transcriptional regulator [Candidatus Pantoea floridensis]|uniref:DNA-binding transcriptional regulator, LysR family n=1 Tax=Candidatus Pantoea floridensis TaxID=1938870 RepID=A0A286DNU4_9GAMM|nr:LysR family transcriptional regulator [Pantoea floridensis]PIF15111.1 DNA-binding transcriptional LysR family regulator [Enterobacteriaceae bacterium JKS000233]SOD60368.1 DNA-binding transcriptional regulator, LysR family [Pantoea floridensis]
MVNTDRLNGIRAFVQAAQAGGFSQAAEQLGLSRSTVGKAVARLEARLQVKLFQRTTRSLSLTSEGEQFYQDCLQILASLDAAENRLMAHASEPTGQLRVAAPPLLGEKWVMPVLLPLTRRWQGLSLDVRLSTKRIDLAAEGVDLAIRIGAPGHHADLTARLIGQQPLLLCAAPSLITTVNPLDKPDGLIDFPHLTLLENGRSQPWLLKNAEEMVYWQPDDRLRFSSMSAVYAATLEGYGIAQLPRWLVNEDIQSRKLIEILPQTRSNSLPIYAVWLKTAAMPLRLRCAIDALKQAFAQQPL